MPHISLLNNYVVFMFTILIAQWAVI